MTVAGTRLVKTVHSGKEWVWLLLLSLALLIAETARIFTDTSHTVSARVKKIFATWQVFTNHATYSSEVENTTEYLINKARRAGATARQACAGEAIPQHYGHAVNVDLPTIA